MHKTVLVTVRDDDRKKLGHNVCLDKIVNASCKFLCSSRLVTTSAVPYTTYSGRLSSSSPMFSRPRGNVGEYYYYLAIRVTVSTTGTYTFTSSSSLDTYGCFYSSSFDPSYPSQNLIMSDDDSAGGNQFQISSTLQYRQTYVLVVTTYSNKEMGSFSIGAVGPASANMNSYTASLTSK